MRKPQGRMSKALSGLGQDSGFTDADLPDFGFSFDPATGDVSSTQPPVTYEVPGDSAAVDAAGAAATAAAVQMTSPPPTLDPNGVVALGIDLNKAVAYGGQIYKYVKQTTGSGQTQYVPTRVATAASAPGAPGAMPSWVVPVGLVALAAYFLL